MPNTLPTCLPGHHALYSECDTLHGVPWTIVDNAAQFTSEQRGGNEAESMAQYSSVERSVFSVLFLLVWWNSFAPAALATHEVDHRFTVHGTVRDGRSFPGKLLAEKAVIIRDNKTGQILQQGMTNHQGQFTLILHVHNEDKGRSLTVQSEGVEKTLELQFDPNDRAAERQAHIDLIVAPK
jgi:hypothetical protein